VEELRVTEPVYVAHRDPIGWDPPFTIAQVRLDYSGLPGQIEQLWLKDLGGGQFRIACVPFCADGLAYLDVVALNPTGSSVREVRERSGHRVLRALLRPADEVTLAGVHAALTAAAAGLGAGHEVHGGRLLAFDVGPGVDPHRLVGVLEANAAAGRLQWEWGDDEPFRGAEDDRQ
jgi:hypothetical protein